MVIESEIIIKSVDWLGVQMKQILKKIENQEKLINPDSEDLEKLYFQLKTLYGRLLLEDENMKKFMSKYGTVIKNEKKKMLFDIVEKK